MRMKKGIFAILAVLTVFAMVAVSCDNGTKTNNDGPFTVTFNTDGGTPKPVDQTVAKGGKVIAPGVVTKPNNDLDGWYNGTTKWDFSKDTVTADITLKAKWTEIPPVSNDNWRVTWDADGGTVTPSYTDVPKGQKVTSVPTPTKANFTYGGWFTAKNGAGTAFTTATEINDSITVYAKWTATSGGGDEELTDGLKIKVDGVEKFVEVIGETGTVELSNDKTGYTFTRGGSWQASYAWFAFKPGTNKLSDFDKVKFTYQGISGDIGYKKIILVANNDAFSGGLGGGSDAGVAALTITNQVDINGSDPIDVQLTLDRIKTYAEYDGNATVYFTIFFNAKTPGDSGSGDTVFSISNIELVKAASPFVPVKIGTTITDVKAPADQAAPVISFNGTGYSATVAWKDASNNTVSGNFVQNTVYTATITLTKKPGYTFDGITANSFTVSGINATNIAGTANAATLNVVVTFPAAVSAIPVININFTSAGVTAIGSTTSDILSTSYTYETTNYGQGAYFKVTFASGLKLSDYSKLDLTFEGLTGDTGYKKAKLNFSSTAITSVSETGFDVESGQNDAKDESGHAAAKSVTLTIPSTTSAATANEVYVAVYFWSGAAKWTISGVKFYN